MPHPLLVMENNGSSMTERERDEIMRALYVWQWLHGAERGRDKQRVERLVKIFENVRDK